MSLWLDGLCGSHPLAAEGLSDECPWGGVWVRDTAYLVAQPQPPWQYS